LNENHADAKIDVYKDLVSQMKEMVKLSMESVKKKLNPADRKFCFELFGYDFIIDSDFKCWLIEVNTNPCLEESSKILQMYLPRMIDDMLKLTLDSVFAKKRRNAADLNKPIQETVYKVTGHGDYDNMWEYLCELEIPKKNKKPVLNGQTKFVGLSTQKQTDTTQEKGQKSGTPPSVQIVTTNCEIAQGPDNGT